MVKINKNTANLDLKVMVNLPYGESKKIINEKVDPLWGKDGVLKVYNVHITQKRSKKVYIEATDRKQAKEIVEKLLEDEKIFVDDLDDFDDAEFNITEV